MDHDVSPVSKLCRYRLSMFLFLNKIFQYVENPSIECASQLTFTLVGLLIAASTCFASRFRLFANHLFRAFTWCFGCWRSHVIWMKLKWNAIAGKRCSFYRHICSIMIGYRTGKNKRTQGLTLTRLYCIGQFLHGAITSAPLVNIDQSHSKKLYVSWTLYKEERNRNLICTHISKNYVRSW